MAARLDVVIFGASGFTGKYTIFEATKLLSNLSWGIAGRSKEKLEAVLKDMGEKAKTDLSKIPIIIADLQDEASLQAMAERAKVVVNCCGPYRFYGEAVVKACINAGTHHVDVSGEPQYMERMQLEYNDLAAQKGVYIVSACGFDSIPADLGTVFFEQAFDGEVNSVETYMQVWVTGGDTGGASIHYGTWESAIYGLAHANELKGLRSKLYPTRLPQTEPRLRSRPAAHRSNIVNGLWCLPFPGSDRSVVMRSQRFFYDTDKKRPIQMKAYVAVNNLLAMVGVMFAAAIFAILARFSFGRKLLLNYPDFFSFGSVSHEGPSESKMENSKFSITFFGTGWPDKAEEHEDTPSKVMVTRVSGVNPGYGATCVALLLSATTILKDHSKMPGTGGVLPPAAAFSKTSLISELQKNGFTFEVVSTKERPPVETENEAKIEEAKETEEDKPKSDEKNVKETEEPKKDI